MKKYFIICFVLIFIIGCSHIYNEKTTEEKMEITTEDSIDQELAEQEELLEEDFDINFEEKNEVI